MLNASLQKKKNSWDIFNTLLREETKQFIHFPRVLVQKMNVIAEVEFELAYFAAAVQEQHPHLLVINMIFSFHTHFGREASL